MWMFIEKYLSLCLHPARIPLLLVGLLISNDFAVDDWQ